MHASLWEAGSALLAHVLVRASAASQNTSSFRSSPGPWAKAPKCLAALYVVQAGLKSADSEKGSSGPRRAGGAGADGVQGLCPAGAWACIGLPWFLQFSEGCRPRSRLPDGVWVGSVG